MNDKIKLINLMWPYYLPIQSQPIKGRRFFCQNAGSCGSMYIVELLKINGFSQCYHEKDPNLDILGIAYYEGRVSERRLKRVLIHTKSKVFFEANNRLFAMTKILKESFPDSRFIHLHRDPRDLIPSSLSNPFEITWESGRPRYTSAKLCGPANSPVLERSCRYWANYNQRILDDLKQTDHLSLKFSDLVTGKISSLEEFMRSRLPIRKIPPVNADKPVRKEGKYNPFESFSKSDKETLLRICGPTMHALGYRF